MKDHNVTNFHALFSNVITPQLEPHAKRMLIYVERIKECSNRMYSCNADSSDDDEASLDLVVPQMINNLNTSTDMNVSLLRCLFQLCNEAHEHNRVALVCTSKWDLLSPLIEFLSSKNERERQLSALILSNLSIPFENKAVMALGIHSKAMLGGLYGMIEKQLPDTYLACICLMNLSYLPDATNSIFYYTPSCFGNDSADNKAYVSQVLDNFFAMWQYNPTGKLCTQSEAIRWILVVIRNITTVEEICKTLTETTSVPKYVVGYLKRTNQPLTKWTEYSIEDTSLQILLNLAKWPQIRGYLKMMEVLEAVEPIIGQGGIHDYRASLVSASLSQCE